MSPRPFSLKANAKAAIDNFTKWMGTEMAIKYGDKVRVVNAIAPGFFVQSTTAKIPFSPVVKGILMKATFPCSVEIVENSTSGIIIGLLIAFSPSLRAKCFARNGRRRRECNCEVIGED